MSKLKKISLPLAIVIQMNAMIGAGIIAIPAYLAHEVGPAGLISYLIGIITVLCMSISLGRLSIQFPGEGWSYLYPAQWGGHLLGMFSSICYVLGVLVAMGFVAKQGGVWLYEIFPVFSPMTQSILMVSFLTITVLCDARVSSIGQFTISAIVILSLMIISIICLLHFDRSLLTPFIPRGPSSILLVAPKILFGFLGFECVSSLYGITKNPQRNVMRAGIYGILIVGVIYLIFSGSILTSVAQIHLVAKDVSLASVLILLNTSLALFIPSSPLIVDLIILVLLWLCSFCLPSKEKIFCSFFSICSIRGRSRT